MKLDSLLSNTCCLPVVSTWVHPRILLGSVLLIFLVFCFVVCFVCLCPVSCVLNIASLWFVYSWLPLRFSLTFNLHQYTNWKLLVKLSISKLCCVSFTVRLNFVSYLRDTNTSKLHDAFGTKNNPIWVRVGVFNATYNNISVISWRSVLLVEEFRVSGENDRPAVSH